MKRSIKPLNLSQVKIAKVQMKTIYGGPTRRAELDHVGAYNFYK